MAERISQRTRRVFLSHSTIDKPFVDRLALDLERVGVGVWYDKWEIRVGESLLDRIAHGIESNDYLAIVLSPNSVESEWVQREVNAAVMRELGEKKVVVLPLLLADCKIPTLLRDKKWADFRSSYEQGFEDLLVAVSPETAQVIHRSKAFRTAQYLITGLAATDELGTNTLSEGQLRRLYPYREQLARYLGPEEKRLIFWSAIAYRRANPQIAPFTDISTPVWGLIDDVPTETRAQWVLEGLSGPLFEHLIPYYLWASRVLGPQVEKLMYASLTRSQSDVLFSSGSMPPGALRALLHALAEQNPRIFDDIFLPNLREQTGNPKAPVILEETAHLPKPPNDAFYLAFQAMEEPLAVAAVIALAIQHRSTAVDLLRGYLKRGCHVSTPILDRVFNHLGHSAFVDALQSWMEQETNVEIRARIAVALTNANSIDVATLIQIANEVSIEQHQYDLLPTIIRALGRAGADPKLLRGWLQPERPIICEAAVFAMTRIMRGNARDDVIRLLDCGSDTVVSTVIEALARVDGLSSDELWKLLRTRTSSLLVASTVYRAVATTKPSDWRQLLDLTSISDPLLKLCAARAFVQIADRDELLKIVDDINADASLRIAADETLFAYEPLQPCWIKYRDRFDEELARLPVRATNFDPDHIWLASNFDLDRTVAIHVMDKLS